MAFGRNSVFRVGLSSNQVVDALLNDGWRFLEAAANDPAPTNPLPQTTEIINYVFDSTWAVPGNAAREANQINAINEALAAWENVANIDFVQGPRWDAPGYLGAVGRLNAEIVFHLQPAATIGGFGGYSGTTSEATAATTDTPGGTAVLVTDHGRVHTYISTDGWMRGSTEPLLDGITGAATPGGMMLMVHEIGHALGLKHPHDSGPSGTSIFLPGVPAGGVNDTGAAGNGGIGLNHTINTIMSYNNAKTTLTGANAIAAVESPMALDIAAIQHLYGANRNSHTGNDTYILTDTSWTCIWDAGGTDDIVYLGTRNTVINLNPATLDNRATAGGSPSYILSTTTTAPAGTANWATGGFTIAGDVTNALADVNGVKGVIIENARGGSGNDEITGNGVNNRLYGNNGADILRGLGGNDWLDGGEGADWLVGGAGSDTMLGGNGNDIYFVDSAGDVVTEAANAGVDEVRSAISYVLGANVENLVLTANMSETEPSGLATDPAVAALLNGGTANLNGTGNALANVITGNAGNNIIDGKGGADRMSGGLGNDTYHVDNAGDLVIEDINAGTDIVISTVTHTLSANVENLTLTGATHINGTGNALANIITGNTGNNIIDGKGGADQMSGGLGNDSYQVDSAGDVVIEAANAGIDTAFSIVTHTLAANVENLTLAGLAHINGTGNALANILTGNVGDNILNGMLGADRMIGGLGSDTYYVDNTGDAVVEGVNAGNDLVISTINYALTADVESLTLAGSAHLNGTGNALANTITGNVGNNILNGGTGADWMLGGLGNDTYHVDNAGDTVIEGINCGTDTVISTVTCTLSANVENLTLTGATHINGTGNALANIITGNAGNNLLNGAGGADRMSGGLGNDSYQVDSAGDVVIEAANAGTDTVFSIVTHTLAVNVEHLTLAGLGHINATGNTLNNTLTGNEGNNILNGLLGADRMIGGLGSDTYYVDQAGDVVVESVNAGDDLVISTISYTLTADVESLTLAGSAHINATGNALTNTLFGNSGNNILSGGAGSDWMLGGLGNDTYHVDSTGDIVTESANSGIDTVISTVHANLGANVENLTFVGSAHINGVGNALNNVISGNAGNNILDGWLGADQMAGGLGNDTYYVDNTGDVVTEGANAGIDNVISTVSHTLAANVENLTLAGTAHINATGNALNNIVSGNVGNNVMRGGAGTDSLFGKAGNDVFVFASAIETGLGATRDVIRDFEDFGDNDTIDLSGFAGTLIFSDALAFSGALNEVIAVQSGADVLVRINTAGTVAAEAEILLANTLLSQVNGSDFIL